MFKNPITHTPFTTDAANDYFGSLIYGDSFQRDVSFLSTLRALVGGRLPEHEELWLRFSQSNYSQQQLINMSKTDALYRIVSDTTSHSGKLTIHNFCNMSEDSNKAWMDFIAKTFESEYDGWHRVEKITSFFRKGCDVICFINPDIKSTYIFVREMEIRRLHYIQQGIFAYLPWYFDPENDRKYMDFLETFRQKDPVEYLSYLAEMASHYDFKTARVKKLLKGFETQYERTQCEQKRAELTRIINSINDLNERIGQYLQTQRDTENLILGLETKIQQSGEESELMEYFLCNNSLVLESVNGTEIVFSVKTDFSYANEDMAVRYLDNEGSYFYSYRDDVSREDMKALMTEILINQRLKLRLCAAYRFRLDGGVSALRGHDYGDECANYMPNPHTEYYACLGTYSKHINDFLVNHDYIGAIEQCIASCKSLNISDSSPMSHLMQDLFGRNGKYNDISCIVLPDGSCVTAREAIEFLKNEKKEQEAETNG